MIVRSPQKYTGKIGNDSFVDGLCENPSPTQLDYYRRHGYEVETPLALGHSDPGPLNTPGADQLPKRPSPSARKADWLAYARQVGADVDTKDTLEQIIAAVAEKEAADTTDNPEHPAPGEPDEVVTFDKE